MSGCGGIQLMAENWSRFKLSTDSGRASAGWVEKELAESGVADGRLEWGLRCHPFSPLPSPPLPSPPLSCILFLPTFSSSHPRLEDLFTGYMSMQLLFVYDISLLLSFLFSLFYALSSRVFPLSLIPISCRKLHEYNN